MPKVLFIDDDPLFLKVLSSVLMASRTDIAIDTAICAEAGFLLIGIYHYDAIISDYRMSGLDGLRLVTECNRLRPGTPVILLTGYGDRGMETHAMNLGAYAFIHKPVQPDALLAVVDRAVQKVPSGAVPDPYRDYIRSTRDYDLMVERLHHINRRLCERLDSCGNDNTFH